MAFEAGDANDRRKHIRFPMVLKLLYSLGTGEWAEGTLINISSRGILFQGCGKLPVGKRLEISVKWPFLLEGDTPLQLRVRGRVVRSDSRETAVMTLAHEFRTVARKRAAPKPAVRTVGCPA
jgi:hypothetical protein